MIIKLKNNTHERDVATIEETLRRMAKETDMPYMQPFTVNDLTEVIVADDTKGKIKNNSENLTRLKNLNGVEEIIKIDTPYKLASNRYMDRRTAKIGNITIGDGNLAIIAGPCAVESYNQLSETGKDCKKANVHILRGGAYKPRTSPYSFQGLEEEGLNILSETNRSTGMPVVTEITSTEDIHLFQKYGIQGFQIGALNGQNQRMLTELGKALADTDAMILLKRHPAASVEKYLLCAEYILSQGMNNVVLCLRGTTKRPGEDTRNHVDTEDIAKLRRYTNLPICYDAAHSCGKRDKVHQVAVEAVKMGADAIMVETHHDPAKALCDGQQSLYSNGNGPKEERLEPLITKLKEIRPRQAYLQ